MQPQGWSSSRPSLPTTLWGWGEKSGGPGHGGGERGLPPAAARPPRARLQSAKASACAAPSLPPRGRNSRPPFFSIHPHPTPAACSPCSSGWGAGVRGDTEAAAARATHALSGVASSCCCSSLGLAVPRAPQRAALAGVPQAARPPPEHGPRPPTPRYIHTYTHPASPDPRPSRAQPLPFQEARTRSRAAGAAQAVTQGGGGDGGGRSGRRRREQMALKETREPAARAHIQLASARRAAPPPSSPRPLASASPSNGSGRRARALLPSDRAVLLLPGSPRLPARVGPMLAAHPRRLLSHSAVGWRSQTHCDDPGSLCQLG